MARKQYKFKVLVAGPTGAGKTAFIGRYVYHEECLKPYVSTMTIDYHTRSLILDENTAVELQFWDLLGQDCFATVCIPFFRGASGALVLFEVDGKKSLQDAHRWKAAIDEYITIPCMLVGNKSDKVELDQELWKSLKEIAELNGYFGSQFISCKQGFNITKTCDILINRMIENCEREQKQTPATENFKRSVVDLSSPKNETKKSGGCYC